MKVGTILLFLVVSSNILRGQSLDEILTKHFEAVGMQYLQNVQTIQYEGNYINHFLENFGKNISEKLIKPKFILDIEKGKGFRLQIFGEPGKIITGFFEGNYWINKGGNVTENWDPGLTDRRMDQLQLDLEGFLFNWEKKGYTATRLDNIILKSKDHYKICLITQKNDTILYYIDLKTNLISFLSFDGDLSDGKKHASVEYQNYKKVENINIPFKGIHTVLLPDGNYGEKDILISQVQINPQLDKEIFQSKYSK